MYSSPKVDSTERATRVFKHNLYLLYLCTIQLERFVQSIPFFLGQLNKVDFTWCHVSSMQCSPLSHWGPRWCCASLLDPGTRAFTERAFWLCKAQEWSHNEIHSRAHNSQPEIGIQTDEENSSIQWHRTKGPEDLTNQALTAQEIPSLAGFVPWVHSLPSPAPRGPNINTKNSKILAAKLDRLFFCPIISWIPSKKLKSPPTSACLIKALHEFTGYVARTSSNIKQSSATPSLEELL